MAARSPLRTLPILPGMRTWISHLPLVAAAVAVTAWLSSPASAQSSYLHGVIGTSQTTTTQQSYVNVPDVSLPNLYIKDPLLNEAFAGGTLAATTGWFSLISHACSGGGPAYSGMAAGSADAYIYKDYSIVSSTLPPGTPVQVKVGWAVTSQTKSLGEDMVGVNTGARATADGLIQIFVNGGIVLNISGTSFSRYNVPDGFFKSHSGSLNVQNSMSAPDYALTVPVGGAVTVHMGGSMASSSSVEAGTTDGDGQMAMSWGVTSLNPDASVVLQGTNQPAPPAAKATLDSLVLLLPPRRPGLLPCFRIPTQPTNDSACVSGDATFSVGATGIGPFTYQWRKDGVPLDIEEYPSAATATLTLLNVSAGNAGSYDVVISNPCGDITSSAATLTLCVASVPVDPAPRVTRLAAAYPVPFRASTTLSFDLATAGEARLEVYDLRGTRVRTLASGWHEAGHSEVVWRGEDETGRRVPAGIYFARLQTKEFSGTRRIAALPR